MIFDFPDSNLGDNFELETNLLKSVIFQIGFPENASIIDNKEVVVSQLKSMYPDVRDKINGEFNITLNKASSPTVLSSSSPVGFDLLNASKKVTLSFEKNNLTLTKSGEEYQNSKQTINEIKANYWPLLNSSGITSVNRIATRKINLIRQEGRTPSEVLNLIFNNQLTNCLTSSPLIRHSSRIINNISLVSDAYNLNIVYGVVPDTKDSNTLIGVLDIDLFKIRETVTTIENIELEWIKINEEIRHIFAWFINPTYFASLKRK